jgi:Mor family transcriptional regulator
MYHDTSVRKRDLDKKNIINDIDSLLSMYGDEYNQFVALGKSIGAEKLFAVLEEFGGQKPHIPTAEKLRDNLAREYRNKLIRDKFNPRDYSYSQLAMEYSAFMGLPRLSERHVRHIVHSQQKKYKKKPENYKPVKVHHEMHSEVLKLSSKYGVAIHAILDVMITIALSDNDIHDKLDKVFGKQLNMIEDSAA